MVDKAYFEDNKEYADLILVLVAIRKRNRYTQEQVAKAMGCGESLVSSIETLRIEPRIANVMKYARAVGAKVSFKIELMD